MHTIPTYSLKQLIIYFLKLGTWGFGGPVALVGYMHRDLVETKKWISEEDYKEGMALSQLAPGPLAAQLCIYIGYVHYRITGATVAGIAFVLPSFFMVLLIGWAYVSFGGLPWMQAIFYGVGAAVIGIIALSSYKLTTKSIGKDYWLWAIFLVLACFTFITEEENIWLILAAGVLIWFVKSPPSRNKKSVHLFSMPVLLQIPATVSSSGKLWQIAWFFTKAGAFVFGSGIAIVPFLYGGVVKEYQWLNEQQFVDAVAVAMITPGPVVITVGFIGYLVGGIWGACIAALATFIPCYVFTVLPAPYFKKYGKHPAIKAFVDGVTAAAIGAIAGAVLVLAKRNLVDVPTALIAITTIGILYTFKKIPEPLIILAASLTGIALKLLVLPS
ncbi:chromate transporter [Cytophaga hutchinsonii]|uniref:Chromate transporter, permease component n=1 Tax=Cytophaga hutchinsonii (strain ATCC 33406 / DSM 1761 / CIP 103989 / NBRC 15051 / NCIMB 9469 / D465) TaxID=269798 RepID=A0A6N4SSJ4_CYTH3|nr:chromate transporter [Cytophaga hutchinsonii]ABG59418.1 chromate transporter, permease component [Cytophaga hutchinsonii ATCC 33406]SFY02084.1 chromate transporter [Cytophaga hutchinsonii ATCC 33406]